MNGVTSSAGAAVKLFGADNGYVCQAGGAFDAVVLHELNWDAKSAGRYFASIGKYPYLSGLRDNPQRPTHCRIVVDSDVLHASRVYTDALKPRQCLKTIFSRTGARRQIDLIRAVESALREEISATASRSDQGFVRRQLLDNFAVSSPNPPGAFRGLQPARRS